MNCVEFPQDILEVGQIADTLTHEYNFMKDFFDNDILQLTTGLESDAEFIPLITAEEEENMNKQSYPDQLPILPLRNNVLFRVWLFR